MSILNWRYLMALFAVISLTNVYASQSSLLAERDFNRGSENRGSQGNRSYGTHSYQETPFNKGGGGEGASRYDENGRSYDVPPEARHDVNSGIKANQWNGGGGNSGNSNPYPSDPNSQGNVYVVPQQTQTPQPEGW